MSHRSLLVRALPAVGFAGGLAFVFLGCSSVSGGTSVRSAAEGAAAAQGEGAGHPLVGKPAPAFSAEWIMGEGPKTLAEARGKVVIVDFWATYCDPCKKLFPKYQELVKQFGGEIAVIAISIDEKGDSQEEAKSTKEAIQKFVKNAGVTFPIVWDIDQTAVNTYNPPKMPTSYLIDKAGIVRSVHAGYRGADEAMIVEEIKALLR